MKAVAVFFILALASVSAQGNCNGVVANQATYVNTTAAYNQVSGCTSFYGLILGGTILNSQNTADISFPSLTTINAGITQGIQLLNSSLTSLSFPALNSYGGTLFRIIGNANLNSLSVGGSAAIKLTAAGPNGGTTYPGVTIQNNPALTSTTIGFQNIGQLVLGGNQDPSTNQVTGNGTVINGAGGTVTFPYLQTAITMSVQSNNAPNSNNPLNAVVFPSLTSVMFSIIITNNSLQAFYVGGNALTCPTVTVQTNPNLNNLTLPLTSVFTYNIQSSGSSSSPWTLNLDGLSNTASVASGGVLLSGLNGLTSFSAANLRYASVLSFTGLPQLQTLSIPNGIITSTTTISAVGNTSLGCNFIIGVQNASSITISGIAANNLNFPSLLFLSSGNGFSLTGSTFVGAATITFPTSFGANGPFTIMNNNVGGNGISLLDAGGLVTAAYVQISGNTFSGTGSPILKLYGLQQTTGPAPFQNAISNNQYLSSIQFGSLRQIGNYAAGTTNPSYAPGLAIQGNANLVSFSTATNTSGGTTPSFTAENIIFNNNAALQSIDLTGLVQVGVLNFASVGSLTTVNAPNLQCAGNVTFDGSPNLFSKGTFSSLSNFQLFTPQQLGSSQGNSGNCQITLPSGSSTTGTPCNKVCYDCISAGQCGSGNMGPETCQTSFFPSSCPGPSAVNLASPAYPVATLTPSTAGQAPPGQNTGTGNGNTGTGNGNNGSGTGNGNGSNNGSGTGTGNGVATSPTGTYTVAPPTTGSRGSASIMVASAALVVFAALAF